MGWGLKPLHYVESIAGCGQTGTQQTQSFVGGMTHHLAARNTVEAHTPLLNQAVPLIKQDASRGTLLACALPANSCSRASACVQAKYSTGMNTCRVCLQQMVSVHACTSELQAESKVAGKVGRPH